jgi:transcription elongation factor Elf1
MTVTIKAKITCPACGNVQESIYPLSKGKTLNLQCAACNKTTVDLCIVEEYDT